MEQTCEPILVELAKLLLALNSGEEDSSRENFLDFFGDFVDCESRGLIRSLANGFDRKNA